jgi:hypothetical protein
MKAISIACGEKAKGTTNISVIPPSALKSLRTKFILIIFSFLSGMRLVLVDLALA